MKNSKYETFPIGQFNDMLDVFIRTESLRIKMDNTEQIIKDRLAGTRKYGQLQGLIDHCEKQERKEKKSVKSVCEVATISVDDELPPITCYFRFVNECPNGQTDETERLLRIEVAEIDGKEIKLNAWQYQAACEKCEVLSKTR